jgi:hypothetical protein
MIEPEQSNDHEHYAVSEVKLSMVMTMMVIIGYFTATKHICKQNGYVIPWA